MFKTSRRSLRSAVCSISWAKQEFAHSCLGDQRLVKRLTIMAADFLEHVNSSIPESCGGDWARTKGAYRFFSNDAVTPEGILSSHIAATVERMQNHRTILAIQDTTTLNFSRHPQTEGLGILGSHSDKTIGIFLHSTLAVTPQGVALGLMGADTWTRPAASRGKAQLRWQKPMLDKESSKWLKSFEATAAASRWLPGAQLVNIADREGDIYELFVAAAAHPNVGVLVRSRQSRPLLGQDASTWQNVARQPAAGSVEIKVPRRPGKAERRAQMEVRFGEATLRPPGRKREQPAVTVWTVEARETNSSEENPLCWRLVTTVRVEDFNQAVERLRWYEVRWLIEEFHRVLKSGCGAEKRQLESADRLKKVLILDLIVAWKILELSRSARDEPEAEAQRQLDPDQIAVLNQLLKRNKAAPLPVRAAVRRIAQLGGFLGRAADGEPGVITIWRGLKRLEQLAEGYRLANNCG